jgi:hypothetical protein
MQLNWTTEVVPASFVDGDEDQENKQRELVNPCVLRRKTAQKR